LQADYLFGRQHFGQQIDGWLASFRIPMPAELVGSDDSWTILIGDILKRPRQLLGIMRVFTHE
jgi:hypothetical protein